MTGTSTEGLEILLERHKAAVLRGDSAEAETLASDFLSAIAGASASESGELVTTAVASGRERAPDWAATERSCRQAVEEAVTREDHAAAFRAHANLSRLYSLLDRHDEAVSEARDTVIAARRAEATPLLTAALEAYGSDLLRSGNTASALSAAEEILGLVGEDESTSLARARGLVLRARCNLARSCVSEARQDLELALSLLTPYEDAPLMAGYQSALSRYWQAAAALWERQGDEAGAVSAMQRAVEHARHVAGATHVDVPYKANGLARTLHRLAMTLLAAGRTEAAQQAFQESRTIRESIGLPPIA